MVSWGRAPAFLLLARLLRWRAYCEGKQARDMARYFSASVLRETGARMPIWQSLRRCARRQASNVAQAFAIGKLIDDTRAEMAGGESPSSLRKWPRCGRGLSLGAKMAMIGFYQRLG